MVEGRRGLGRGAPRARAGEGPLPVAPRPTRRHRDLAAASVLEKEAVARCPPVRRGTRGVGGVGELEGATTASVSGLFLEETARRPDFPQEAGLLHS